jgi:hypothetical protein
MAKDDPCCGKKTPGEVANGPFFFPRKPELKTSVKAVTKKYQAEGKEGIHQGMMWDIPENLS